MEDFDTIVAQTGARRTPRDTIGVLCTRRALPAWLGLAMIMACLPAAPQAIGDTINPAINPPVETDGPPDSETEVPIAKQLKLDFVNGTLSERVERILAQMTLDEKIGQLCQIAVSGEQVPPAIVNDLRAGRIGSMFYTGSAAQIGEAQRIAQHESRLGLPLLAPRDVIHGFRTVFPIPLGQAASWDPELIEQAAEVSAREAQAQGVNWTFAPMMDITRDARWGRIAESLGEDPVLASAMAAAMVRGYQGKSSASDGQPRYTGIAACAKHYVAYGLSEGGRDYNRAQVAVSELHNVFLPPFHAAVDDDCLTVMTGFSTINGTPATGNKELLKGVLKQRWGFEGLVVSDWTSILEMIPHGFAADKSDAARLAIQAGVDMEMASTTFREYMRKLVDSGEVDLQTIDNAVSRVLWVKLQVALPGEKKREPQSAPETNAKPTVKNLAIASDLARKSIVLLKNERGQLPLDKSRLKRVALIGPMVDAERDQLGCWMLDGKPDETQTLRDALSEALGEQCAIEYSAGTTSPIDDATDAIADAVAAAEKSDVAILCVGESWLMSGEARCRVDLGLPGAQSELVREVAKTNTPIVLVVMAGRPLTIGAEIELSDAVLYAWHPGTMGGPALVDLLLGVESPSGKLPVTFPKHVGQAPLYYNHPNTGRPALAGTRAIIGSGRDDFPEPQKYRSHYIDVDPFPLLPFGYGLSYTTFEYGKPELTRERIAPGQVLGVRVKLTNTGKHTAEEIAQLYVQDVTARLVRPVRELKAFRRVRLEPGESTLVEFALQTGELAYFDNEAKSLLEPGKFRLGVGGDSTAPLNAQFDLIKSALATDDASTKTSSVNKVP